MEDFQLRLTSFGGLFVFVFCAWLLSTRRQRFNWRIVLGGLAMQLVFAVAIFSTRNLTFPDSQGKDRFENGVVFAAVDSFFGKLEEFTDEGREFVFRTNAPDERPKAREIADEKDAELAAENEQKSLLRTFAFGVLPTVIFFSSLMSVLYHLRIMPRIVSAMGWMMQKTFRTSGAESLSCAANVFVGHTEAPLVVKPYIPTMTRSEMMAMMVGGFSTISGGLMAIYAGLNISAGHLLTASIISAPAALMVAKIMVPETETPQTIGTGKLELGEVGENLFDAAVQGAADGLKLALNIGAMLIAFLALIALVDYLLLLAGESLEWVINLFRQVPVDIHWSLEGLFSLLFFPLAWVMGIESGDCGEAGKLLGKKIATNEFLAYVDLSQHVDPSSQVANRLSQRSQVILTYALSGFANFGAIGIQIGGIGGLAPDRRRDLAQLGFRAMIGGVIACCMTACIAGMIL
ncbi:MAG: nucleoside transporter C-terminal domain-containing protein [Planctomycetota bacterium]|nr:nucleoside transporter C-terminal domain-containing protein [Planctomycetota bacterium]